MKKILTICLILLSFSALAQTSEEKMKLAMQLAEEGKFNESNKHLIDLYSTNYMRDLVCYNLSVNYFNMKNYIKAEKFATESIKMNSSYALQATVIKGKCLSINRKYYDEEELYQKMIQKYPKEFLLHNLLGYNYIKQSKTDKAEEEFQKSVKLNPFGSEAHLALGNINKDKELLINSLLCYYYFLMTEPNTTRTLEFVRKIGEEMNFKETDRVIAQKTAKPENLSKEENDLIWAMLFINSLKTTKLTDENKIPEMKTFVENSKSLITNITESIETFEGFYEEFYVQFFSKMLKDNMLNEFLYYSLINIYEDLSESIHGVTKDKMLKFADFLETNTKNE